MNAPEPWKDTKAMEEDLKTWVQSHGVKYDENMLNAFRIGWKAGAMHTTVSLWRWFCDILMLHGKT